LQNILKMFRVSDDMPVEAEQVSDALDKVQGAVEEKYREIRGEIFKFDEVLNGQRNIIYNRRRNVLFDSDEEAQEMVTKFNAETVADIVKAQTGDDGSVDTAKVVEKAVQFFPQAAQFIEENALGGKDQETTTAYISAVVEEIFKAKSAEADKKSQSANSIGRSARYITLVTMDNAWSDHLQAMENLKESVVLRQFQGLDPLKEYESEAFGLFKSLENTMRFNAVFSLWQSL